MFDLFVLVFSHKIHYILLKHNPLSKKNPVQHTVELLRNFTPCIMKFPGIPCTVPRLYQHLSLYTFYFIMKDEFESYLRSTPFRDTAEEWKTLRISDGLLTGVIVYRNKLYWPGMCIYRELDSGFIIIIIVLVEPALWRRRMRDKVCCSLELVKGGWRDHVGQAGGSDSLNT